MIYKDILTLEQFGNSLKEVNGHVPDKTFLHTITCCFMDDKAEYLGIKNDEYDTIVPMCKNYFDAIPQNELPEKLRKKETKKKKENKK